MKLRKVLSLILCVAMVMGTMSFTAFAAADIWDGSADTSWYDAADVKTEYTIDSAAKLAGLAALVNGGTDFDEVTFTLTTDIDLAGINWTPIGLTGSHANDYTFRGYFDGNNKTISNLSIADTTAEEDKLGLFGHIHGNGMTSSVTPSVKDLTLTNVNISSTDSKSRIGAVAGNPYTCAIRNVDVYGTISGGKWTGGIAGNCYTYFEDCTFTGTVTSKNQAGGIAGAGDARVYDCQVYGDISATYWAGGIVGNGQEGASAVGCYVEGDVSASSNWYRGVGGIAGVAGHGYNGSVYENNYFNGEVYLEGEKIDVPVIGFVNVETNEDINTTVGGNSWNTDYYPADLEVPVVGEVEQNSTADEYLAGAKETIERNDNLVMLPSDLPYVDAENAADVTVMPGSSITDEQVENAVENRAVANISYAPYAVEPTGEFGTDSYRESIKVDLDNVNATKSLVVELWDGETKLSATTLREYDRDDETVALYPVKADSFTCNIVLDGTRKSGSWDTEWFVDLSTQAYIPNKAVVYVNDIKADTFTGDMIDVDTYVANTKVIGAATIRTTEYATLEDAFNAAAAGDVITLASDIVSSEQITVKDNGVLSDITFDGNGKTITHTGTGKVVAFGSAADSCWATGVKISNLTINGTNPAATQAISLVGGTSSVLTNVKITGDYAYAVNFYGTHGATLDNCQLVSAWTNGQDDYPLNLTNGSVITTLWANDSEEADSGAKVFIDATSSVEALYADEHTKMIDADSIIRIGNIYEMDLEVPMVAKIGGVLYGTLQAAVDATNGNGTITLMEDLKENVTVKAPAAAVLAEQGLVIDLNGKTLTGSIKVEANQTVEVKNGIIVSDDKAYSAIETVGTTTLTDLDITSARHAIRVEGGIATINGGSYKVAGTEGMTTHALNVSDGANVVVNGGIFTGPAGTVGDSGAAVNVQADSTVEIYSGKFGGGKNNTLASKGTLVLYGGSFDQIPDASFLAEGCEVMTTENAEYTYWVANETASKVKVVFVPTADASVYDIKLVSADEYGIYKFVGAELTFENTGKTVADEDMHYEIYGISGKTEADKSFDKDDTYALRLVDGADAMSGAEFVIGQVKFIGYGTVNFKVTEGTVAATQVGKTLEHYYTADGDAATEDTLVLDDSKIVNGAVEEVTGTVVVNVAYNHILDGTGWGGNNQITVTLKDAFGNVTEAKDISDGIETFTNVKLGKIVVTLEAPGFRKYVYQTNLESGDSALVLNFWNEVKRGTVQSPLAEIETGKGLTDKNFLVGDIVMDYIVDEYDLAAVTSYYGMYNLTDAAKYIKYDLNRDGNIDIIDVAYVLHSYEQ